MSGISVAVKVSDITPSIPIINILELGLWAMTEPVENNANSTMNNILMMCKKVVLQNTFYSPLKVALGALEMELI